MKIYWNHDEYAGKRDGINTWKIIPHLWMEKSDNSKTFIFEWLGLSIQNDDSFQYGELKRKHQIENGLGETRQIVFETKPKLDIGCMIAHDYADNKKKLLIHLCIDIIFIHIYKTFVLPWRTK